MRFQKEKIVLVAAQQTKKGALEFLVENRVYDGIDCAIA